MNQSKSVLAGFFIGLMVAVAPACGPAVKCSPTTCPTGCCDSSGTCQQSSQSTCGQLGQACTSCQLGQTCNLGTCVGTQGGGNGSTGGGSGTTGGGSGTTGGGDGTTGGGSGTTGGGNGTTGGGNGTTGGGNGTTGGGNGTTGGGNGTTGGGTGTTGGGTGTTGGGTGSCTGCFVGTFCFEYLNSNTNTSCGQGGQQCSICSGTQTCDQTSRTCVGGTGGGTGTTGGGTGTTGGGTGTTGGGTGTTGGGTGTTNQPIGGACTSTSNCASGLTCKLTTAQGNATYTGGYCSRSCTSSADCGAGGLCAIDNSVFTLYGEPSSFCMAGCASAGTQSTCRNGYSCMFNEAGMPGACWLNPIPMPVDGNATSSGNACTADSQCQNPPSQLLGTCFEGTLPDGGFSGWTGGHCTADCSYDLRGDFCGPNATCIKFSNGTPNDPNDDESLCLRTCSAPGTRSTCRTGYTCFAVGTANICYPDCTAGGCDVGQTCNTTTGHCQ